jgi:hypothetical protein
VVHDNTSALGVGLDDLWIKVCDEICFGWGFYRQFVVVEIHGDVILFETVTGIVFKQEKV